MKILESIRQRAALGAEAGDPASPPPPELGGDVLRRVETIEDALLLDLLSRPLLADLEGVADGVRANAFDRGGELALSQVDRQFHRNVPAGRQVLSLLLVRGDLERVRRGVWRLTASVRERLELQRKRREQEAVAQAEARARDQVAQARTAAQAKRDAEVAHHGAEKIAAARALGLTARLMDSAGLLFTAAGPAGGPDNVKCLGCAAVAEIPRGTAARVELKHAPVCPVQAGLEVEMEGVR